MSTPATGKAVADFSLPGTGETPWSLKAHRGSNVVLYFYPRDHTPGCTREGESFRDLHRSFAAANTIIVGISPDSLASHEKFKTKMRFPFELLSDEDRRVCKLFDVIKPKSLYGRKFLGVERSTFLIDGQGKLRQEWRRVKVDGHAAEVLQAAKSLS
ncbi:MAG TPA: peroxiredoxin [Steroidobacteraceae bacterium]|nr:peroxiredoxin [Steroidobacteraceae bacterium]